MEANVDTSHPRRCRQLTGCLIKVVHGFMGKCWQNGLLQHHQQGCAVFTQEPDDDIWIHFHQRFAQGTGGGGLKQPPQNSASDRSGVGFLRFVN